MFSFLRRVLDLVRAKRSVFAVLVLLGMFAAPLPLARAARSPLPVPLEEPGGDLGPAEQIKPGKWTG